MQYENSFLELYMDYVEETESPRIFHLWSAISAVGACLGRRAFLPWGTAEIFANQYILLVGPPATRKSTAINLAHKLVGNATTIRFAPDDTGGRYQGLLTSMAGQTLDENEDLDSLIANAGTAVKMNGHHSGPNLLDDTFFNLDIRDTNVMYSVASEFSNVIGEKSHTMVKFLIKVYDGEDYQYKLKNSDTTLEEPLLSILGGTNTTDIVHTLPENAIGGGFTSRLVLVHALKRYKKIYRPKRLDETKRGKIEEVFRKIFYEFEGEFQFTQEADAQLGALYNYNAELNDPRFVYYEARRQLHLLKLSMCLAAARGSLVIYGSDILQAHEILKHTEKTMIDAFGEYGLSKLAEATQKLVEFIQHCDGPVPASTLWYVMQKDMKQVDFLNTLRDLERANKVFRKRLPEVGDVYVYVDKHDEILLEFGGRNDPEEIIIKA